MKNYLFALLLGIASITALWAHRDKLLPIASLSISKVANVIEPNNFSSVTTAKNQVSGMVENSNKTADKEQIKSDLETMLNAFDKLLNLDPQQEEEVLHQSEKAVERLAMARNEQRSAANLRVAEQQIIALRDEMVGKILTAAQLKQWHIFLKNRNAANSLSNLRATYEKYKNGTLTFKAKSEGSDFLSLEDMRSYIDMVAKDIQMLNLTETELQEIAAILYNL